MSDIAFGFGYYAAKIEFLTQKKGLRGKCGKPDIRCDSGASKGLTGNLTG
jgi:hypothetical protein